jgi:hypothetical protein
MATLLAPRFVIATTIRPVITNVHDEIVESLLYYCMEKIIGHVIRETLVCHCVLNHTQSICIGENCSCLHEAHEDNINSRTVDDSGQSTRRRLFILCAQRGRFYMPIEDFLCRCVQRLTSKVVTHHGDSRLLPQVHQSFIIFPPAHSVSLLIALHFL